MLRLTPRDHVILFALVLQVRLFSQRQLADHFWGGSLANARRRMKWLAANGLVKRLTVQARILSSLTEPILTWKPGSPAPNFGAAAHSCQQRWKGRPSQSCVVWIATDKAAKLLGGVRRGELKNPVQASHDLGVSSIWLRYRETDQAFAKAWRGEDVLAHTRQGQKLPDAFIVDQEQVTWVIEFGAGYDTARVQDFHHDCFVRAFAYQLW